MAPQVNLFFRDERNICFVCVCKYLLILSRFVGIYPVHFECTHSTKQNFTMFQLKLIRFFPPYFLCVFVALLTGNDIYLLYSKTIQFNVDYYLVLSSLTDITLGINTCMLILFQ